MAVQNISESQIKTHLTIFKHSKKFSFGFQKSNNTWTVYK